MIEPSYKSDRDPDFLMAARRGLMSLSEAVQWCQSLLAKCEKDASFEETLYFVLDPGYELESAQGYQTIIQCSIDKLEHPDRSTPAERRSARIHVTMVYSWSVEWDKGLPLRDRLYSDPPPTLYDAYDYTPPSGIANVLVNPDQTPGIDPFADNQ